MENRRNLSIFPICFFLFLNMVVFCHFTFPQSLSYKWLNDYKYSESIKNRISVPAGYTRIKSDERSFAGWLKNLPLKKMQAPVYLFDGKLKDLQNVHFAVIDIDVDRRNLQQCADAIIRLHAEYLYSVKNFGSIKYKFTSGHSADFMKWIEGYRPVITGNRVRWKKSAEKNFSYSNFRKYLETIFIYSGSYSLNKELSSVNDTREMKIGDVFIEGGFPGHAVIVVDMAVHIKTGEKIFLLAQSYMPAQDIHILKNFGNPELSPWYKLNPGEPLVTPEWTFATGTLKSF